MTVEAPPESHGKFAVEDYLMQIDATVARMEKTLNRIERVIEVLLRVPLVRRYLKGVKL